VSAPDRKAERVARGRALAKAINGLAHDGLTVQAIARALDLDVAYVAAELGARARYDAPPVGPDFGDLDRGFSRRDRPPEKERDGYTSPGRGFTRWA
jgi:hypothetical protein